MKKNIFIIISLIASATIAQTNEQFAQSYFLKAQETYSEGNNKASLENLDKTVKYLGNTNPKIEALYVKIEIANNNYISAEEHLKTYFDTADTDHSDYNNMLSLMIDVKEKATAQKIEVKKQEEKKKKIEEYYKEYYKKYGPDVPFAIIEFPPVYPGCIGDRKQMASCFSSKVREFLNINFDKTLANKLGLSSGKKKVWLSFRVGPEGKVVDIRARAPHPSLKKEAIRAARALPIMKPANHNGKQVGMKYSAPISFTVD
ncbi:energy transducer TonB [Tenacibaculum holothuriorum]|uniref:energy transducer TonB n=1 Tax=Tenacibaculum holothuriorum TaxID=1635173 RepID=UPI000A3228E2|nr:energy transducer TonB [Tenacibaculum holothuriorum]